MKDKIEVKGMDRILYILGVLDQNRMNKSKTAKEVGVNRNTIISYHTKYWDEYIFRKNKIKEREFKNPPPKLVYDPDELIPAHEIPEDITDMLGNAVKLLTDRLKGNIREGEGESTVTNTQLINLVSNITPYYLAKKDEAIKTPPPGPEELTGNTFIQNFISQVNNYKAIEKK